MCTPLGSWSPMWRTSTERPSEATQRAKGTRGGAPGGGTRGGEGNLEGGLANPAAAENGDRDPAGDAIELRDHAPRLAHHHDVGGRPGAGLPIQMKAAGLVAHRLDEL